MLNTIINGIKTLIGKIVTDFTISSLIIKIWVTIIILYTGYKGYQLGWTVDFIPEDNNPFNNWSLRANYANEGLSALLHLNIVSIIMASCIVVLPVLFFIFMFKERLVLERKTLRYLSYSILTILSIYTFLRIDTPTNYYASRYFLPILVPALVVLYILLLSRIRSRALVVITLLIVIIFNLRYDFSLYEEPVLQNRFKTIEQITNVVPPESYIFLSTDIFSKRLLIPALTYMGDINSIYLKDSEHSNDINQLQKRISEYMNGLKIETAYVLSISPPHDKMLYHKILFTDERHPFSILYPTNVNKREFQYYLYKININLFEPVEQLTFGETSSSIFLLEGFSEPEESNDSKWRWSDKEESTLLIPLKENTQYRVKIRAMPFNIPNNEQKMDVFLNGNYIESITLDEKEFSNYYVDFPRNKVESLNEVVFKYAYARSPKEIYEKKDTRLLAVNFKEILFEEITHD